MRLIDANVLMAELHDVCFVKEEDRKLIYELIERQPSADISKEWAKRCQELQSHVDFITRQNENLRGQIRALAFAVRCGGVSGNEVRYETD